MSHLTFYLTTTGLSGVIRAINYTVLRLVYLTHNPYDTDFQVGLVKKFQIILNQNLAGKHLKLRYVQTTPEHDLNQIVKSPQEIIAEPYLK